MVETYGLSELAGDFLAGLDVERRSEVVKLIGGIFLDGCGVASILPAMYTLERQEIRSLVGLCFTILSWMRGVSMPDVEVYRWEVQAIEKPQAPAVKTDALGPEPAKNVFVFKKPEVSVDPSTGIARISVAGKGG